MKYLQFRKIILVVMLAQASACTAEQPAAIATKSQAPVCEQANALLANLGTKNIFSTTPDDFLKSTGDFLKIQNDTTVAPALGMVMRKIEFTPSKEWLESGELNYDVVEGQAIFDGATFVLNSSCFAEPGQLLTLSAKTLGEDFNQTQSASPDTVTNRIWYWPDPDANYIRFIDLYAGETLYHIKVERDPAPQQGD